MAETHKNQHTIPETYLKGWCDPACPPGPGRNPYVWITSCASRETRRKAPHNLFCESDFYTIRRADGTRDLTLEHELAKLESAFAMLRDRKIERGLPLTKQEHRSLCLFCAALHARAKAQKEHQRAQWSKPLEMCREIEAAAQRLPPEKLWMLSGFSSEETPSISMEELEQIVENPIPRLLQTMIDVEAPLLLGLDIAVLRAKDGAEFVTSDDPCVWIDPEALRMPPAFQAPALAHRSIEIRLPISPHSLLFLNRQDIKGYREVHCGIVDQVNRDTVVNAHDYVVHQTRSPELVASLLRLLPGS